MSKPVTENALVMAWPGSGLPKTAQFAGHPRREDDEGDDAGDADEADPLAARTVAGRHPGDDDPDEREPDRLVAGQRREPQQRRRAPSEPRIREPRAARIAGDAGHQQARARARAPRTASSSRAGRSGGAAAGRRRVVRPVPSASVRARSARAAPRSAATSAASRQASTGTSAPISTRRDLGGRERRAEQRHRDRGEERRERHPDLEGRSRERQRRRAVAPQRVGDEAAALQQVARDADVVGRVLGLREDDLRREERADDEGDGEDERGPTGPASRRVTSRPPRGRSPDVERIALASGSASPSHAGSRPAVEDRARPPSTLSSRSRTSQRMS